MFWLAQVLGACSHKCCCRGQVLLQALETSAGVTSQHSRDWPGSCWCILSKPTEAACLCLITRSTLAERSGAKYAFPLSLVKPFPTISINETKLKHSLFCAACFVLFPTQLNFLSQTGICLLYNSRERRQGHTVRAFCWRSRRSSRVRSGLGISFQPRCRILPPTRCKH